MYIISLVNQLLSPSFRVLKLNQEFDQVEFIDHSWSVDSQGATGICILKSYIYIAFQNGQIGKVNQSLSLDSLYESVLIKDPHSIASYKNKLYVASTGTNSVVELSLDRDANITSEKIFWKYPDLPDYNYDYCHLNSLVYYKKDLYVSTFGVREKGSSWQAAKNGNLINTRTSKIIIDGLNNPHNLIKYKQSLAFCNSGTSEIMTLSKKIIVSEKTGYIRGMVYDPQTKELLYVINARRLLKKSSFHKLRGRIGGTETKNKSSYIKALTNSGESVLKYDLSEYGKEIYDIQIVSDSFQSIKKPINTKRLRITEIEESFFGIVKEFNESIEKIKSKFESDTEELVNSKTRSELELSKKNVELNLINNEIDFLQRLGKERKKSLSSLEHMSQKIINDQNLALKENIEKTKNIGKLVTNTNQFLHDSSQQIIDKIENIGFKEELNVIKKTSKNVTEHIENTIKKEIQKLSSQTHKITTDLQESKQAIDRYNNKLIEQTNSLSHIIKTVEGNNDKIQLTDLLLSNIQTSLNNYTLQAVSLKDELNETFSIQSKKVFSKLKNIENKQKHSTLEEALLKGNELNLFLQNESKTLLSEIDIHKIKLKEFDALINNQKLKLEKLHNNQIILENQIEFDQDKYNEMVKTMDVKLKDLKSKINLITTNSDAQIRHLEKLLKSKDELSVKLLNSQKNEVIQEKLHESLSTELNVLKNEIKHRDKSIDILNEHIVRQINENSAIKQSFSFKIGYYLTRIPALLLVPFIGKKVSKTISNSNNQTLSQSSEVSQNQGSTNSISAKADSADSDATIKQSSTQSYKISKISVITPSYNQADFLPDCINAIKNQSFPAIEHLIYDPGSNDGSVEIAKKAKGVTLINEKDDGQADAIARGMLRAKGEIIAWLNSDDFYENNDVFKTIIERFNEADQPDMIYCTGYYLNEKDEKIKDAYINKSPNSLHWKLQEEVGILQPAMFFKKSLIEKIGPVNKLLHFSMDYEFWIRAVKSGAKIVYLDTCTTIARYYQDNKTMGQRGKSLKEICDMVLEQYGYVNHKWLKRYAEFLVEGLDGVLNNRSNSAIKDEASVKKVYKGLLRQYNLSAKAIQTLETNKNEKGYQSTYNEMSKLGLFTEKVKCQEIALDKKTISNHVCYTVATKRWAFDRKWKDEQVRRTMDFVNNPNRKRKSKCIIVGNGPSLRKIDFSLLKDQDVFICNNTFMDEELLSCAKYYTVVNNLVAEQGYQNVNAIKGITKIFPYWLAYCVQPDEDTYFVNSVGHPQFSTNMEKNVSWRHTVSFFNMQLAYGLGYDEVALIGMDHSYRQDQKYKEGEEILELTDDDNHFNPNYFKGKKWHAADVDNMEAMYLLAKEAFEKDSRKIYNCTDGGHLELFDRMSLREFLYKDSAKTSAIATFHKEFKSSSIVKRINSKYDHLDEGDLVLDFLEGYSKDKNMINVGAHHGWGLKKFVENQWNVYAFEPDNKNRKILKQHLGKHKNLIIDPRAVSNKEVTNQSFFTSKVSTGISSLGTFHESHKETQAVNVTTITKWHETNKIKSCDFLLVDVEGYDLFVLEGFPWDKLQPKVVIAEFEDSKTLPLGYSYKDLGNYLLSKGYKVILSEWYPIVEYGKKHKWNQLQSYPCDIDDKAWGNFIAIKNDIDLNKVFNDNF